MLLALLVAAGRRTGARFGAASGYRNTYGLWAIQRRRIDAGEGDATVLVGASRIYFDIELPVWERLAGKRPIQLAFEGTSPLTDSRIWRRMPKFTGRLLIGVAPDVFFSGFAYRGGAVRYTRKESPSQRIGQWLSMRFIEPYLAFYDPDFCAGDGARAPALAASDPGKHAFHGAAQARLITTPTATAPVGQGRDDPEYRALRAAHLARQLPALAG